MYSASDDHLFQDHFDDNYFDDYDFEDRPLLVESPRLNEFDTNTYILFVPAALINRLPTRSPPSFTLAQTSPSSLSLLPEQRQPLPENTTSAQQSAHKNVPPPSVGQGNTTSIASVISKHHPGGPPQTTSRPSTEHPPIENPLTQEQQPQPLFMRVARDGSSASPYNHRAGNFSPMTTNPGKVDYSKSTPVAKPNAPSKVALANNTDAHNRMGQSLAAFNPPHRIIGCPPTGPQSPYRARLPVRALSGPSLIGVKRNHQGQPVK